MKYFAVLSVVLALSACAAAPIDDRFDGLWTLRIRNLAHREVSVATIRFTDDPAPSCIGGDWKRVIVESVNATDDKFFPFSDALSYMAGKSEMTIGRNEVCDAYLHLRGELQRGNVHGSYVAFGRGGGEVLGDFTLGRSP